MDFSNTSIVELAAIVAEHLQKHDVNVVLVGGLAVEIIQKISTSPKTLTW